MLLDILYSSLFITLDTYVLLLQTMVKSFEVTELPGMINSLFIITIPSSSAVFSGLAFVEPYVNFVQFGQLSLFHASSGS